MKEIKAMDHDPETFFDGKTKRIARFIREKGLKFASLAVTVLLLAPVSSARAQAIEVVNRKGGIAVFGRGGSSESMNALTREAAAALAVVFNSGGRLVPVEAYRLRDAMLKVQERGANSESMYEAAARLSGVDTYVIVSVWQFGNEYIGEMTVVPVSGEYPDIKGTFRVKSGIMMNVPLKLAMAAAEKHRGVALRCRIEKTTAEGLSIVNAGQWHGIREGTYKTSRGDPIEIVSAGRYDSVARLPEKIGDESITIAFYPDVDQIRKKLSLRIEENIILRYGLGNTLLKNENPEKRYIEGMCIINPGSNVCIPGYGAFLATHYLGFQQKNPDIPGIIFSTALVGGHFMLVPVMTGFRGHFFPWVDDNDKSKGERGLQVFLWATAPFAVSAAYLDQLAVQLQSAGVLPPFFADRNVMAGVMSVLVPGGGLFYKGRRLMGWAYYLAEIPLAGYGIYAIDNNRKEGLALLAAAGVIKVLEIVHAVISQPGYDVYRREGPEGSEKVGIIIDLRTGRDGDSQWRLGVALRLDSQ